MGKIQTNGVHRFCRSFGKTSGLLLVLALAATARGSVESVTIIPTANANLTGSTVNSYSPSSYGLVINIFQNTYPVIDYNLAAIPLNATVNSAQFSFRETSYTSSSGIVNLLAYPRTGAIVGADASTSATNVGTYDPVALGLGFHSTGLNASGVSILQSLLGTNSHLGLRLRGNANTQIAALEHSTHPAPSITASYSIPNQPILIPRLEANITGSIVNQYNPASYGLVVNTFDGTRAVIDYTLSGLPAGVPILSASFSFRETSVANFTGNVSLHGYARSGNITGADGTAPGTLIGSYGSVALGLGEHSVSLNAAGISLLQSLMGSSNSFGLRLTSASSDTNTSIASLDDYPAWSPAKLALTLAPRGDANSDGLVSFADFISLANSFGQANTTWVSGDFNNDHITNFNDFVILANNFGQSIYGQGYTASADEIAAMQAFAASAAPVPEPASLAIIGFSGLFCFARRRR